jgi:hypothetical protein
MHSRAKVARSPKTRGKIKPPDRRAQASRERAGSAGGRVELAALGQTVEGKIKPPD